MNELLLFVELLKIEDAGKRLEKLSELAGGDEQLCARVEELLDAHARASAFMATSQHPGAGDSLTSNMPHTETIGSVIGPYKLLQEIGEGGMGTVFMAEQSKPVQRRVALKIIKAGMDTRQVIARFEAERQALAIMDHPNIAKVLDAGATATGRPYFVMELVKGTPITKYCDEKQLSVKDRLELFIQVCLAIQHAHQKGIIHRDIKPTNVLIAQYDGKPIPKVIDFGVAKATAQKLTDKTMFTEFGMVIGTVEYMSPEQAEINQLDIDTRSDVYSLGVLLYELLTGTTPLESKKLRAAAHAEMLRMIREEEPSRPSLKLSTSATLPSVAASRGVEPARLKKMVAGELDWIVMKTLEKERARRYGSPLELGNDLLRYLNNEPILACPPSTWYQLRKMTVRNRAVFAGGGVVLAGMLLGVIGLTVGLMQANHQATKAIEAADREIIAREKAEAAEVEALNAYRSSMDDTIQQLIGSQENLGAVERAYLESTLKRWEDFAHRKGDDRHTLAIKAEAWAQMGTVFESLGRASDAKKAFQQSVELRSRLAKIESSFANELEYAKTLRRLGLQHLNLDQVSQADSAYSKANEILIRLQRQEPQAGECAIELGKNMTNWGLLKHHQGQLKDAQTKLEAANLIYEQWRKTNPEKVDEAVQQQIKIHTNLGNVFSAQKMFNQALEHDVAAKDLASSLLERSPSDVGLKEVLRKVRNNYASHLNAVKRFDEAASEFKECVTLLDKLAAQYPARLSYQSSLALTHANLEIVHRQAGRHEEAEQHRNKAINLLRKLVEEESSVPEHRTRLAQELRNAGSYSSDMGKLEQAISLYNDAIAALRPLMDETHATPNLLRQQGRLHASLAKCEMKNDRNTEALAQLDAAKAVYDRLSAKPLLADDSRFLAQLHFDRAECHKRVSRFEESLKEYLASCALLEGLIRTHPEEANYYDDLGRNLNNMANLYTSMKRSDESIACLERSIRLRENLIQLRPEVMQYKITLGNGYSNLGARLTNSDRPSEALPWLDKGIALLSECKSKFPADKNLSFYLWNAVFSRGKTYLKLKEYVKAKADFTTTLDGSPAEERFRSHTLLTRAQILDGELEPGMKNLLELQQQKDLTPADNYSFACLCSIASVHHTELADSLESMALRYLEQAVASGDYDRQKILDDEDFEPLRTRPDFMGLIAQLEAKGREMKAAEPQRAATDEPSPK
jgi:serine/threonine protein kinase